MGIHHKDGLDDFTLFLNADYVVPVAKGGVAFFVNAVGVGEVSCGDFVNVSRSVLVVVVAPNGRPGDLELLQKLTKSKEQPKKYRYYM